MKWTQLPLGPVQANAYIVEKENGEALIIDPGGEGDRLVSFVKSRNLEPLAILLTHAHFDHIGAVEKARTQWSIPVYLHQEESGWLNDPQKNGSAFFPGVGGGMTIKPAEKIINGEGPLNIGSFSFEVVETPGHSPGSVSFFNKASKVVFSGDALFAGSIGRTDLYRGDHDELLESIEEKLLILPGETIVAPGHGPETTIESERRTNPFLSGM
ncbi:MAG TPA: MBL fold metallo-hydrolase [Bacillales bacterium]|nr:MBL fold metallo-hydrolase [Bacillales bacterium]